MAMAMILSSSANHVPTPIPAAPSRPDRRAPAAGPEVSGQVNGKPWGRKKKQKGQGYHKNGKKNAG